MSLVPLVAVVGPTASGKTALAVKIAKKYNGEVVSADSMQIYRKMNIGTAKPDEAEKEGIPHHMIDIVDPVENYSVAQYVKEAKRVIEDINSRGKLPVLCGGTGLYVNSLVDNIEFSESDKDENLRNELHALAEKEGGEALLKMLAEFDQEAAAKLHPNNVGRIIRAIEVYKTTGVTMTETQRCSRLKPPCYNLLMLGLTFADRSKLYSRTDERVDIMMQKGLKKEVRELLYSGINESLTSMQAIGYKELALAVNGQLSKDEAVELIKKGTRHYAKRQLTWFRRDERINWLTADDDSLKVWKKACELIDKWRSL